MALSNTTRRRDAAPSTGPRRFRAAANRSAPNQFQGGVRAHPDESRQDRGGLHPKRSPVVRLPITPRLLSCHVDLGDYEIEVPSGEG